MPTPHPPPPLARSQGRLAYLGVKLSVAPAARCAAALAVVLNSSRHLRSVIVDRSIGGLSCVVGAGRENLEWNFYTPRSFDGPHRSILDRDRDSSNIRWVRVAREIYTVHRPPKNDPVNKNDFACRVETRGTKHSSSSIDRSWRRTIQVNQEAEVCELDPQHDDESLSS